MIEQHNSLSEKFLKKGFWLYFFSFIIGPIGYIIKIIISSELSVSEVWILYWIISLIVILSAYNDLWMTESLKHFIPEFVTKKRYDKIKSVLFYAFFVQIFSSLLISLFFYFWADYIAQNYFKTIEAKEILKVFAFFFIWLNIFQTINNFFMAVQDTFNHKLTELIRMSFIMFSVLFIFFWDYYSLLHYSYSWLIWLYIWVLLILFIFYKKYYKNYFFERKNNYRKKINKKNYFICLTCIYMSFSMNNIRTNRYANDYIFTWNRVCLILYKLFKYYLNTIHSYLTYICIFIPTFFWNAFQKRIQKNTNSKTNFYKKFYINLNNV